jgi:hypothetical protein
MAKNSDFVAGLAKGGKSYAEIWIAILDNIVTMDETMVSYHMPETEKQSKQRIKKGQPGPIKVRVHAAGRSRCCWRSLTEKA